MKKAPFVCALLFIIGLTAMQAQELNYSIPASGSDAAGSQGTISYSVGQLVYSSKAASNGNVNEGVQQPYEILVLTGFELAEINLNLSIYPNPTNDYLIIKSDLASQKLRYQLYDLKGGLLKTDQMLENETRIELGGYQSSVYIVKILEKNEVLKSFKIIKN